MEVDAVSSPPPAAARSRKSSSSSQKSPSAGASQSDHLQIAASPESSGGQPSNEHCLSSAQSEFTGGASASTATSSSSTAISGSLPPSSLSSNSNSSIPKRPSIVAHVTPFARSLPASSDCKSNDYEEKRQTPVVSSAYRGRLPHNVSVTDDANPCRTVVHERAIDTSSFGSGGVPVSEASGSSNGQSGSNPCYLPPDAISVFHTLVSSAIDQCLRNSSQSKVRVSVFSSLFDTVSKSSTASDPNSPSADQMTSTQTRNNEMTTTAPATAAAFVSRRQNGFLSTSPTPPAQWARDEVEDGSSRSPLASPGLSIDEDEMVQPKEQFFNSNGTANKCPSSLTHSTGSFICFSFHSSP